MLSGKFQKCTVVNFKVGVVLSTVRQSCALLLCPRWDMSQPFVRRIQALYTACLSSLCGKNVLYIRLTVCVSHSVLSDSLRLHYCSPPDSSVHGLLQARILEWVAIPFSRGSFQPRDRTQVSGIAGTFFTSWTIREAHCIAFICVHSFIHSTKWGMVSKRKNQHAHGCRNVWSIWKLRGSLWLASRLWGRRGLQGPHLGRVFAQPRSVGFQRKGSDWRVLGSGWKSPAVWKVGRNRRCTETR